MGRSLAATCHALTVSVSVTSERRSRAEGIAWFAAGYAGVMGFLVLEASTRQRGAASSLDASRDDRGTTRMIVAVYATAALAAPLVRLVWRPKLPRAAGPVGVGLEAAGLGLRAWSMRTLGGSYSRTLRVDSAQGVVEDGPYRLVRHPGYAGHS
jgi:protein-S-isoprenylcysteine O-methyltransferase Ste14